MDENGTSLVPTKYVSPSKYKLGMQLSNVRSDGRLWKGKHDEEERKAWLENLPGWRWKARETHRRERFSPLSGTKRGREEELISGRLLAYLFTTNLFRSKRGREEE